MTNDERIAGLEKQIADLYREAEKEMRGKWDAYMARQEKRAEKLRAAIDNAKTPEDKQAAEAKYKAHLKSVTYGSAYYRDMVEELARQYADAGRRAAEIVNGERIPAFADGYNFTAGEVNNAAVSSGVGIRFDLCDADTVARLLEHGEDLLLPPKADPSNLDMTVWNVHNINAQVTQGIVQGESIPHMAQRLSRVTGMNQAAAVRTARTMATGCENAGRVQGMERAETWGVHTRKKWMCTHDSRTRDSHLAMDGETADPDGVFSNGCEYPGDPGGPAEQIYNCRCSLITVVDGFSSNLPKGKENAVHVTIDGERVK